MVRFKCKAVCVKSACAVGHRSTGNNLHTCYRERIMEVFIMGEKISKDREKWVDVVRGFAIYLVVLGHSIQYATPHDYNFRANIVFRWIYGFHMPLFMIVSGYLFWYTINRYDLLHGVIAKIKGIMIPCASWGFVTYACDILMTGYEPVSVIEYLRYTASSNWFLWAIFYCSLYGFVTKYVFRNSILGYVVIIAINYIIPEIGNYAGTKRMLPFFIIGMLVNRYQILKNIKDNKKMVIVSIITLNILYLITIKFNCIELITGTIGSAAVILAFFNLCRHFGFKILCMLGKASICIYLFTGIVFYFWIKEYCQISDTYRYRVKILYIFLLSVGLTMLAFVVSQIFQKSTITSRLFLGK